MESVESMSEGEWGSLNGMYNTTEEADFMAQLLANPPMPLEICSSLGVRSHYWPGHESMMNITETNKSVFSSSDMSNPNWFLFSRKTSFSNSTSSFSAIPTLSNGNYVDDPHPTSGNTNIPMLMEFFNGDAKDTTSYLTQGNECMSGCNVGQESSGDRPGNGFPNKVSPDTGKRPDMPVIVSPGEDANVPEIKRRLRTTESPKIKRNVRTRRNQKHSSAANAEEESNADANGQNSSTSCSDDDSNGSQNGHTGISPSSVSSKENPAASKLNGKSRASRGTATDPQSLYARKRRERINERLKVLQSLVPNGTKVDISTMLEEAVEYVKFLQLQIKLLSSDDLWMYAPLAYNGMSIGLDLNIPIPPKRS